MDEYTIRLSLGCKVMAYYSCQWHQAHYWHTEINVTFFENSISLLILNIMRPFFLQVSVTYQQLPLGIVKTEDTKQPLQKQAKHGTFLSLSGYIRHVPVSLWLHKPCQSFSLNMWICHRLAFCVHKKGYSLSFDILGMQ